MAARPANCKNPSRRQSPDSDLAVAVDCAKVTFISSAGLRVFLIVAREISQRGGKLAVCNLNKMLGELFTISGFDRIIPVHADVESASASLRGE